MGGRVRESLGGLGGDLKKYLLKRYLLSCLEAKNCWFVGLSPFANQRDTSSKAAQSPVLQRGLTPG